MIGYIERRLLMALFTVWAVTVLTFIIIQLPPGDSVDRELMRMQDLEGVLISQVTLDELRAYLGLGQPQYIRYSKWMWNLAQGDMGISFQYFCGGPSQKLVKELVGDRIQLTVVLTGFTILVT